MGRIVDKVKILGPIIYSIYMWLPIAFIIVLVAQLKSKKRLPINIIPEFMLIGVLGYLIYHIFPVVGPIHLFKSFPYHPLPLSKLKIVPWLVPLSQPRNCVPSLHLSWVLLIWWHARSYHKWIRVLAFIWLVGTIMATLGLGYHYVVDLVISVPFTLAIRSLCSTSLSWHSIRGKIFLLGAGLSLFWLLLIRFGVNIFLHHQLFGGVLIWSSTIFTIIISVISHNQLWKETVNSVPKASS